MGNNHPPKSVVLEFGFVFVCMSMLLSGAVFFSNKESKLEMHIGVPFIALFSTANYYYFRESMIRIYEGGRKD